MIGLLIIEANASKRLGAVVVLHEAVEKLSRLEVMWVDQGYSGPNFQRMVQSICGKHVRVDAIKHSSQEFEVLPRRWRSFGWMNRYRRLSKDYELTTESSEVMIYGTFIRLMVRRLVA